MDIVGTWHIYVMESWDADYFNMDVQAFIKINKNFTGYFQFGLIQCDIDGEIVDFNEQKRFEFTFDGIDENDHINGRGWIMLRSETEIEGRFKLHLGDGSLFHAKKVN